MRVIGVGFDGEFVFDIPGGPDKARRPLCT